ncbi:MAG: lysophospholipid acyltransferase family protein [gamma proteobacterium symbiont of Taylorina sp.]|nr:lysophospholipid acyltransferase family protein [gamma proteobacterium symbiont of Taylorina sp.]
MNLKVLFFRFAKKISFYLQILDYRYLLPASTYLPLPIGIAFAYLRGIINFIFDLEWRSLSTGQKFVRKQTWHAITYLRQDSNILSKLFITMSRFVVNSREEWEACYFSSHSMQKILDNSTFKGLEAVLNAQQSGRGIVLLTPHFDSYCTGMVLMGMKSLHLNAMKTDAIFDPRVNPAIQKYFSNKFVSMEQFFNGGRIVADTDDKRFFYKALQNNECVVIGADLPAVGKSALNIPFLGGIRKMAPGPMRLAKKTNSLIAGFVCLYKEPGKYQLEFSPLYDAEDEELNKIYQFFESNIRAMPQRWWVSDLFYQYK